MHEALDCSKYTGSGGGHGHHHHSAGHHHHGHGGMQGFCQSCCHPRSKCGCGCRECRKESKELLVKATTIRGSTGSLVGGIREGTDPQSATGFAQAAGAQPDALASMMRRAAFVGGRAAAFADLTKAEAALTLGAGTAFIGGGCCVHLSIEYTPITPTSASMAIVLVDDSEGTILAWAKTEPAGTGYKIRECIITTKPGADLNVLVVNMTARVRWCEIFSC